MVEKKTRLDNIKKDNNSAIKARDKLLFASEICYYAILLLFVIFAFIAAMKGIESNDFWYLLAALIALITKSPITKNRK